MCVGQTGSQGGGGAAPAAAPRLTGAAAAEGGAAAPAGPAAGGGPEQNAGNAAGAGGARTDYQDKVDSVNEASAKASSRGDIQLVPADEGWEIHVQGKPVAQFDTAANARMVLAQARKLVGTAKDQEAATATPATSATNVATSAAERPTGATEQPVVATNDRRADTAQRLKVSQMTPEQMKSMLLTNELTGIPNRRAYQESEKQPVQTSADVDSLKWVNDNWGHEAGDQLLKEVASLPLRKR